MDKKIRIGVLGPSEIAFRRTVPAIIKSENLEFAGVAKGSLKEWPDQSPAHGEKCKRFTESFGGKVYDGYMSMINDPDVHAIYIPLPPSAHYKWAEATLKAGKHIIVEKPFTIDRDTTMSLIRLAEENDLAVHENYAYAFHKQIKKMEDLLEAGSVGELRMIRSTFSFPYRGDSDFRYHKERGGGALIDCGGYPLNLASRFLGEKVSVLAVTRGSSRGHDVDTSGCAMLEGDNGITAQVSWGTDNTYRCNIELHGSSGVMSSNRVFSPTAEMTTNIIIEDNSGMETIMIEPDDQFLNSIEWFVMCINNKTERKENYKRILKQASLLDEVMHY